MCSKEQTIGNANSTHSSAQAAEILFIAEVGARKECPSEVLQSINPKYLVLPHSLVITPLGALLAYFVTVWQQLSPYLHTYMPKHCSYLTPCSTPCLSEHSKTLQSRQSSDA